MPLIIGVGLRDEARGSRELSELLRFWGIVGDGLATTGGDGGRCATVETNVGSSFS